VEESPLSERRLPIPVPGRGEIRLRVLACGVCRTDVHLAEGDLPPRRPSVVPGHQIVGVVDALGLDTARFAPGALAGVTWLAEACGDCDFCREGRENLCGSARFTGWDRDGGFAQFVTAREDFVVPMPAEIEAHEAAPLLCAGVIGWRALRLSGVKVGERLGLVGFGASAHLVLQAALHLGCEVRVFTRGEDHRRRAREMGAAWAGGLDDAAAAECHAAILFAPSGRLVMDCLRHLRRGGTLVVNAVHLSDLLLLRYEGLFGERVVRSVSHVTRGDAAEFLDLAVRAPVRAEVVRYAFARANEALQDVKAARIGGQAVLDMPEPAPGLDFPRGKP
jgi:propanol-preferring alcohol dehydrogenase